ncbi:hypothetical protein WA538_002378 [Blastocystis sp. DL]
MESKRRKLNPSGENSPTAIFGHGCKGIFVTSDRNKEGAAVKEVYRLLEDYMEELKMGSEHSEDEYTTEQTLDKELEELTQKKKSSSFARVDLGMKGITFIRILDESISPVAAVKAIFKKIKSSGMLSTRFAARIIPIERTCYAHLEDVIAIVSEEIKKTFTEETAGKTWFCNIKRRNNNTFDREALINAITPLINTTQNPVCLRDGDICIHVDVDKGVCGVSVITEWKELNELSLRTVLEEKKPKETKESKVESAVNALDKDWKCGSCGAPNFQQNDVCWKCQHDRRRN